MTNDSALKKVRKLLNMTTENGCTESEAMIAASQAQKLMIKHNLSNINLDVDDEEYEEIKHWEDPLDVMPNFRRSPWRGSLAVVLCEANGCSVFWDIGRNRASLSIVGRASDVMTVRYLQMFCVREIGKLAKQYKGNGTVWLNNWRMGVVHGINQSLKEAGEEAKKEFASETGTALMVIDNAMAEIAKRANSAKLFAHKKFNTRSARGSTGRSNYGAHSTGKKDGKNINLKTGKSIGGAKALRGHTKALRG